MIKSVIAGRHFCARIQALPSMLFLKVEERCGFFIGPEPLFALSTTPSRALTEVTENLHSDSYAITADLSLWR